MLLKAVRMLDYAVASAALTYGIATFEPLWMASGVVGLVLAKANVADRVSRALKKFLRKGHAKPAVLLEQDLTAQEENVPNSPRQLASYGQMKLTVGTLRLSAHPLNRVRGLHSFNHAN